MGGGSSGYPRPGRRWRKYTKKHRWRPAHSRGSTCLRALLAPGDKRPELTASVENATTSNAQNARTCGNRYETVSPRRYSKKKKPFRTRRWDHFDPYTAVRVLLRTREIASISFPPRPSEAESSTLQPALTVNRKRFLSRLIFAHDVWIGSSRSMRIPTDFVQRVFDPI